MSFTITLVPGNQQFDCAANETILDAAMRNGLELNYGCRKGVCGNCIGDLLEGEVRYPKDELRALGKCDANKPQAVYCSAIPASDLVIQSTLVEPVITAATASDAKQNSKILQTPCKVTGLNKLCHDVMQLFIKVPEALNIQFKAGQYLDILLSNGEHRSFSIANAPRNDHQIELHIRHVDGGEYTAYIFEQMQIGDILRIELPLGTFYLREQSDRPIIMMGGGTGFAPLKGMIEQIVTQNIQRPIHLFWGVRTEQDLYMSELPNEWQKHLAQFNFTPVLSEPKPDSNWQGATGFVHQSVIEQYPDLSDSDLYMSGPPIMIEAARDAFIQRGLPQQHMYSDAFEYNAHP